MNFSILKLLRSKLGMRAGRIRYESWSTVNLSVNPIDENALLNMNFISVAYSAFSWIQFNFIWNRANMDTYDINEGT